MVPGPKKKGFLAPRHNKNIQINKPREESRSEIKNGSSGDGESALSIDCCDSAHSEPKKYTKRSIESNWKKYEESVSDPFADYARGSNIEEMLNYSGGAGSQLKLKEEKEWESDSINFKGISLNLEDLVNSMKCIPFHERISIKKYFNDKQIENFILSADNWKKSYKSKLESQALSSEDVDLESDPSITVLEEPDLADKEDASIISDFAVHDKTVDIINSLTSNLTFKDSNIKKQPIEKLSYPNDSDKETESASNDLDFLLSLNISSKEPEKNDALVSKTSNVDDWLNSILDG